jgi:aminocarboxymuconate-semialdehyde decarboxylase
MKIDIYSHILPEKYRNALMKKVKSGSEFREMHNRANCDLDIRLRLMDRYPDVLQVLIVSLPSLETVVSSGDAVVLAKIANDELAEIVDRYPDKFIAGVACLPLNNIDEALKEADRAINELGLKGVQIVSTINGETLDLPKFKPLYEKMADCDLPIWIHPVSPKGIDEPLFGWPFETASAMRRLVASDIFDLYPDIKFITHHCGSMVPFFEGRIKWMFRLVHEASKSSRKPLEHFRRFYNDTAVYGSTSALMCSHDFFGTDHLLFGSDAPLGPDFGLTGETVYAIEQMEISIEKKEKIFWRNAIDLLKIAV